MDCRSEFTCSERTKRRFKTTVEKHVRAIAMDMKSKSDENDFVAEVSGDCSRFLPPPSDLVNYQLQQIVRNAVWQVLLQSPMVFPMTVTVHTPLMNFLMIHMPTNSEADEEDVELDVSNAHSIRSPIKYKFSLAPCTSRHTQKARSQGHEQICLSKCQRFGGCGVDCSK
jgi:hypothetical protein